MRFRRLLAVFSLVFVVCGACSSAGEPGETARAVPTSSNTTTSGTTGTSTEPEAEPEAPQSDAPVVADVYISPIGEALGVALDEIAVATETYVNEAEELVRQCMADAGFEYEPTPTGLDQAGRRQFELEASLSAEDFTDEYGFGITTLFELNFKDQGVVDFVNQQFGPAPAAPRSPGEQAAYEIALNGETTQGLSPEEAQEQLFGTGVGNALEGSCRNYGYSTAENPGSVYDGLFSLLGDEVDALTDRFDNDPRIRTSQADWQTCMAARGHAYESVFEIRDELFTQSNDLANTYLTSSQVLTALGQAQEEGFVAMNNDDRYAFLEQVGALQGFAWVPDVQQQFDELIAFELVVAADSRECTDEDLLDEVQFELETEFVEQHAEQLALIAAGDA